MNVLHSAPLRANGDTSFALVPRHVLPRRRRPNHETRPARLNHLGNQAFATIYDAL